ncbi:MAG: LLM class F420-dependent oxidoreductase [Myxococcota bacterium]|nr:LLM class F420-dependent oxidoreductase [Myxococcota bacterium]
MRFSVQLPLDQVERPDEFLTGAAVAEMARAAEAAGVDAVYVTDHPFPGDRWLASGGHHALDPFVSLSFAAAATTTLRLQTNILVLPYRNPFLVAKAAASLDVHSGGRLILGVGAGYLKPEFKALGADVEERGALLEEGLVAMKAAWTEDGVAIKGRHFEARGNTMRPRPVQQPHPPVWVGGNSRVSIERAARHGEGWIPFPTPAGVAPHLRTARLESVDDLRERLDLLHAASEAAGRTQPLDVCMVPFIASQFSAGELDADAFCEEVEQLRALGVTWTLFWIGGETRAAYLEQLAAFGERVVARFR